MEEILAISCYPNIVNVSEPVDLAVIAIPAETVPQCVEQCGLAGVEGVMIVASDFREIQSHRVSQGNNRGRSVFCDLSFPRHPLLNKSADKATLNAAYRLQVRPRILTYREFC